MTNTEQSISTPIWQPTLEGAQLLARPLQAADFDALFAAASDPAIWELHPVRDRYTRPKFELFFQTGIASGGALVVVDRASGTVVGSSRFTAHDPVRRTVEIGYTFLARSHWGTGANRELKTLMLTHAFQYVDAVEFFVGVTNFRSRGAMEKLGGKLARTVSEREPEGDLRESVVYVITKDDWQLKAARP
jgi:RimJ/RimL family protein N-acetyltransferase